MLLGVTVESGKLSTTGATVSGSVRLLQGDNTTGPGGGLCMQVQPSAGQVQSFRKHRQSKRPGPDCLRLHHSPAAGTTNCPGKLTCTLCCVTAKNRATCEHAKDFCVHLQEGVMYSCSRATCKVRTDLPDWFAGSQHYMDRRDH